LGNTGGKKTELSKDVSAFANSDGGSLIYGVTENRETHEPLEIDVGYDPAAVTEEWIEQVINSRIKPRIDGARIKAVALHSIRPGKILYVVYVPQSLRAPHMASDHRYYRRYNFQSVPMEDYEVRDVGRRIQTPDLRGTIVFARGKTRIPLGSEVLEIRPYIWNEAEAPAEHAIISIAIDSRLQVRHTGGLGFANDGIATKPRISAPNAKSPPDWITVVTLFRPWGKPGDMPIWAGTGPYELTVNPIEIVLPDFTGAPVYYIYTELHSPRMIPRSHLFTLEPDEEGYIQLSSPE
jgi:hypothetical protein